MSIRCNIIIKDGAERKTLESLQDRFSTIYCRLEENDIEFHYENGTAASQVSCAIAALECIIQENEL